MEEPPGACNAARRPRVAPAVVRHAGAAPGSAGDKTLRCGSLACPFVVAPEPRPASRQPAATRCTGTFPASLQAAAARGCRGILPAWLQAVAAQGAATFPASLQAVAA